MESTNQETAPNDVPLKKPSIGMRILNFFLNIFTLGKWNKLTPRERAVGFTAWNFSSWFTIGQVTVFNWVWTKFGPLVISVVKSAWAKTCVAVVALKDVTIAALKEAL